MCFNMDWRILGFYPEPEIYFDSDMSKSTNTVVYLNWKTVIYIYVCGKCTIHASKFEQTIIHQHVHLRRKSQSHSPAHVRMRLYHR